MQKIKHLVKNMFQKIRLTTPSAIIVAAVILGASHVGYGYLLSNGTQKVATSIFKGRAIDSTDLVTGDEKSKVILVEYSDTECPFCAQVHPTIKKLQEAYGKKIGFAYRYFPLTQIHPNAFDEARAVYCVGKELGAEKKQEYVDMIFAYKWEKQNMVFPKGKKEALAKDIGVNEKTFNTCLQGTESSDVINASIQDGIAAGVQGTPASFVLIKTRKGYETVSLVDGARPYEYFEAIINDALAR